MGRSTGKVPAILDYCRGMGLVQLARRERSGQRRPELTPFGRTVWHEDPLLREEVTQWVAHLNLCNRFRGADVWFHTFCGGSRVLGMSFLREQLESHLSLVFATQGGRLIGPLVRMYEDDAAFGTCGALTEANGPIERVPAPLRDELGLAYGAWVLQLLSDLFPEARQVSVPEFDQLSNCLLAAGWGVLQVEEALRLLERKGAVAVDRHMEPWLLRPMKESSAAWSAIYDDLM